MKDNIQKILLELYKIDPELQAHEEELTQLITLMMNNKPEVKIDSAFAHTLREKLVQQPQKHSLFSFLFMNKTPVFVGAGAFAVVLALGLYTFTTQNQFKTSAPSIAALFSPQEVIQKSTGAFGSLAFNTSPAAQGMGGFGGGGVTTDAKRTGLTVLPQVYYNYKYVGDAVQIPDANMPVYRRVPSETASRVLANQLKNAGAGLLDLNTFPQMKVGNISFSSSEYTINLDIANGKASMYPTWYKEGDAIREAKESDVPADAQLIQIANSFLKSHSINEQAYGAPVVDNRWKKDRERYAVDEQAKQYVPNIISVVYPYSLEEKVVSDYGGGVEGMRINIHILNKKVDSAWNILAGSFESSAYAVETNADTIKKFAEQGGLMKMWEPENAEKITLELGTPKLVYVQHYMPRTDGTTSDNELFVPALQFPVVNGPKDKPYYYQEVVTIPMVKQIIDEAQKQQQTPPGGPVTIMQDALR